jgi:hypothetical protein
MATENQKQYYAQAIRWGEEYLQGKTEAESFKVKLGETISNDIMFVSVQVERIKYNKGREQQAAYSRLREFKQFFEKIKENSLLDKLI